MNGQYRFLPLFEVMEQFVLREGGDGEAWLVSKEYKEIADLFATYQENDGCFCKRRDYDDYIVFSDQHDLCPEEYICFTNNRENIPTWSTLTIEY